MIIVITGDREWGNPKTRENPEQDKEAVGSILAMVDPLKDILILGDARGVDTIARGFAEAMAIDHVVKYARWNMFHGGAGPIRNGQMISHALMLHHGGLNGVRDKSTPFHMAIETRAFNDNISGSRGTRDCVIQSLKADIPTFVTTSTLDAFEVVLKNGEVVKNE